eukprot:TRINITY_DN211_c0_g1_i14.p1 TRINITY_DN211_c0_g1~~TRINITY_DN211_c0_g1_i14.p1  ORF type:complete len:102 (-),score=31.52 TRINITY_DN211_c0_g1_i14:449-709(-)
MGALAAAHTAMLLLIISCGSILSKVRGEEWSVEETRPGHYLIEVLSGDEEETNTEHGSNYADDGEYGSDYGGGGLLSLMDTLKLQF